MKSDFEILQDILNRGGQEFSTSKGIDGSPILSIVGNEDIFVFRFSFDGNIRHIEDNY